MAMMRSFCGLTQPGQSWGVWLKRRNERRLAVPGFRRLCLYDRGEPGCGWGMDRMVMATKSAIIPARGGSKSIPRKNIRPFAGHPLSLTASPQVSPLKPLPGCWFPPTTRKSPPISRQYGAETPFLRPAELAQDDTPDLPVFQHALRWLDEHEG